MSESNSGAMPPPTTLERLTVRLPRGQWVVQGDLATVVTGIAYDSRQVRPGDLYCCIHGFTVDGHDFVGEAAASGAVALLTGRSITGGAAGGLPQIVTRDVRRAVALAADAFYGHPSGRMAVVGVTGTNGKTSTTYMVEEIFRNAGKTTGLTGTVETRIGSRVRPVTHTTPEAPDLQRLLWEMAEAGVEVVSMEVSSHALRLDRTYGTKFAVGVFTNLTQDHLDFHRSMEEYYLSKRRLFDSRQTSIAVLNADDPWSSRVEGEVPRVQSLKFSVSGREGAEFRAKEVRISPTGTSFTMDGLTGEHRVNMRLLGGFTVANALAAAASAHVIGATPNEIVAGLEAIEAVPGRFEPVRRGQPFLVVVDYAHTPDAVGSVLESARHMSKGDVTVVVGCGGDRDRSKRPLMARAALDGASSVVFTSDNPRSEDPESILSDMLEGADPDDKDRYVVELDRRQAIGVALDRSGDGDVVVVAGKGHEAGQTAGGVTQPFDDRVVVAEELAARGFGGNGG